MSAPAFGAWHEASTDKFLVYSDSREGALIEFTRRVEKFDQVLRLISGYTGDASPVKMRIYLVDEPTVRELDPTHRPNIAGFYSSTLAGGVAVVNRRRAEGFLDMDSYVTLCHEYTHHFMQQYFPLAYPRWYAEGFAEMVANAEFRGRDKVLIGRVPLYRAPSLLRASWITTARLMNDPEDRELNQFTFYAESWLLTHYFFEDVQRRVQMLDYITLRDRGVAHALAMQRAMGRSDEELDRELRAYLAGDTFGYITLKSMPLHRVDPDVRTLPASADVLLLTNLRMDLGVSKDSRQQLLDSVRIAAQRLGSNPEAELTLARVEARYGDPNRAGEILRSILTRDPSNRRVLLELAALELESPDSTAGARPSHDRYARWLAVQANHLETTDTEALYLNYRSFAHEPNGATPSAIAGLAEAYSDLPQNEELAMSYAGELLRAGDSTHAVGILRRIAYQPHGGDAAKWAQSRLKSIESAETVESPATDPR
jgi:hypothetical protein